MKRNISALMDKEYDLVVVGGGAFGACTAWDAALRGLSVALVERGDFCHATSANCFKIVHGGIRYLQHGDITRLRQSSKERNILLRIAPHLVEPLPIVLPTYGHGMQGKALLNVALKCYDFLTFDRNKGIEDPDRRIPNGGNLTTDEVLKLFPELDRNGLTGAAIIYDGHMYSPPRLTLEVLKSAGEAGAVLANYVEATEFIQSAKGISGIRARDLLSQQPFEVRAKMVVNAAGPWAEELLKRANGVAITPPSTFSRDACLVIKRRLHERYALAVKGQTKDPDALLSRGPRHLFVVPWREYTLIGVWHVVHSGTSDSFQVTNQELQQFLDEVNSAYPAFNLTRNDVSMWNAGLTLFGANKPGAPDLSYGKRSRIVDHAKVHGLEGLVTLVGVRYTMARKEAAKTVDLVYQKLQRNPPQSRTDSTPVCGGCIGNFNEFVSQASNYLDGKVNSKTVKALVRNHGSEFRKVWSYAEDNPILGGTVPETPVLKAEILYAVREEMAVKLADVVLRRTDLGSGGYPGLQAIRTCAEIMGSELGWDEKRLNEECQQVKELFSFYGCQSPELTH